MRKLAFAASLLVAVSAPALSHTTSLGYTAGANNGEVTFWAGSYAHGGTPQNEGLVTITNLSTMISQTLAFNIGPVSTKPTGLVDGVNNFFWGNFDSSQGRYPFPLSADPNLFGGVVSWQGVTFTGLTAGNYSFGCGSSCGTTAQWSSLNGSGDIVQLTLSGTDVGGGGVGAVPEPGTWALMLIGFGAIGASMRRRRVSAIAQMA